MGDPPGDRSQPSASEPLPFKADAAKPPPPSAVDELPEMPDVDVGSTAALGELSPLAGMALPFGKAAKQESGAEHSGGAEPSAAAGPSSEAISQPTTRLQAVAPTAPEDEPDSQEGETATLGETSPIAGMELPFRKPSAPAPDAPAPSVPELTVEQYAAVHAACEAHPDRVADSRRQYGVADDTVWQALTEAWSKRLQGDTALQQQFEQLLAQYRQWHQGQG